MCLRSCSFPSIVLGNVVPLCKRVCAVLILCCLSWCELKSKYLSVCVGFLCGTLHAQKTQTITQNIYRNSIYVPLFTEQNLTNFRKCSLRHRCPHEIVNHCNYRTNFIIINLSKTADWQLKARNQ